MWEPVSCGERLNESMPEPEKRTEISMWTAIIGILVAFVIAGIQWFEARRTKRELLTQIDQLKLERAREQDGRLEAESTVAMIEEPAGKLDSEAPPNVGEYIEQLEAEGINLDWEAAKWRRKKRPEGAKGNLGYFVEPGDPNDNRRWFIHKGRGWLVREAIPRDLLEIWEEKTGENPQQIAVDTRAGSGPGNHGWLVETYDGRGWKVHRGRVESVRPIQVA